MRASSVSSKSFPPRLFLTITRIHNYCTSHSAACLKQKTDMLMALPPVQSCYTGSRKKPVEGKVARSELNKALQTKRGFVCSRSRKKALVRCAHCASSLPVVFSHNVYHAIISNKKTTTVLRFDSAPSPQRCWQLALLRPPVA